jgi:hypothetical protein
MAKRLHTKPLAGDKVSHQNYLGSASQLPIATKKSTHERRLTLRITERR